MAKTRSEQATRPPSLLEVGGTVLGGVLGGKLGGADGAKAGSTLGGALGKRFK